MRQVAPISAQHNEGLAPLATALHRHCELTESSANGRANRVLVHGRGTEPAEPELTHVADRTHFERTHHLRSFILRIAHAPEIWIGTWQGYGMVVRM